MNLFFHKLFLQHVWGVILKINRFESSDSPRPYGFAYHLRCTTCGAIKKKKV